MFSYQNVNGANIVSLEDSEKNENFWKLTFAQKWCFVFVLFFQNICNIQFFVKTTIYPKQNLPNSTFLGVKGTQIWSEKEGNPLRGQNCLADSPKTVSNL